MNSLTNTRPDVLLSVLENAVDAIISINEGGEVLIYNAAAEALFQYSAEQIAELGIEPLMTPGDSEGHQDYIGNYLKTGKRRIIGKGREVTCCRRDGSEFPAHLSISESSGADQRVFTAVIHDLSERERLRETEAALKETKLEHNIVLQYAPVGIVTMDVDGAIQSANRSALRISGYEDSELMSQPGVRFVHTDDHVALHSSFRKLMRGEITYTSSTHKLRHRDGHYVPIRTFNAAVAHSDPAETVLISMFEDLSSQYAREEELKVQRERLAHVSRLTQMGEMAAGLAHELNQPLSAIASYAGAGKRLVGELGETGEELHKLCSRIGMQATRAGQVIRKVRDLTRRHETTKRVCSINRLIEELLPLVEVDFEHTGITFNQSLGPDAVVRVDAVQIEQVLLNFLRNSIDAVRGAPPGERLVSLATAVHDGSVTVSVSDTGGGLDPAIIERVFEPFVSSKDEGMGMGLAISKSIVDSHDGEIAIENIPGGALSWFRLPIVLADTDDANE